MLKDQGIIPGIKVDKGLAPLGGTFGEQGTLGEYLILVLRFAIEYKFSNTHYSIAVN